MTRLYSFLLTSLVLVVVATSAVAAEKPAGLEKFGPVELKSAGPIAFGPSGVLFVGDPMGAALYAVEVPAAKPASAEAFKLTGIDAKVAKLLGAKAEDIVIKDIAVQPGTNLAYLSVANGKGADAKPSLVTATPGGDLAVVPLDKVNFAQINITNAPAPDAKGRRGNLLRAEAITDVAWTDERVFLAGLSSAEAASTLRAVRFPFEAADTSTSVEIFHGAHGKFETGAPVRAFVPLVLGGEPHLLAAYTCTPLVKIPISDIKSGGKLRGKTVAELGNRNQPIDVIAYQKDGKNYLLMANSARGVMKIATDKIDEQEAITEKIDDTAGLSYQTIDAWKGIDHLTKQGDAHVLLLVRNSDGVSLESAELP